MMDWLQENIFTLLSAIFGGSSIIGYFSERSRRKILERKETSDALVSMQAVYNTFTEDYLQKYQQIKEEMDNLKENFKEVLKALDLEKEKNRNLEEKIRSLQRQISSK